MRAGLDGATATLYTGGSYDTHIRLKIENVDGTFISLEGRYKELTIRLPDPLEPIGSMKVTILRDSTIAPILQSLSPLVEGSDLNEDDLGAYSPLLQLGRQITVDCNLTAIGAARPGDGDGTWYEIFRGVIGKVDWPEHDKHDIKVDVDGLGAVLQHAKSEVAYTYDAGISLETAVTQVLLNNGFSSVLVFFPVATGKVLPNIWEPGLQKTVWSQLVSIAQTMGWVCYYQYNAQNPVQLTFFEPARTKTIADHNVNTDDFKMMSLDDAEVRNVGFLIYVDGDGVEQIIGPDVDTASLSKYGGTLNIRRPFWIKLDEFSPIRSATEAQEMLTAALLDVADPDIVAIADTVPIVFGESGTDLYDIPAQDRFFDTAQKWALFSNELVFDVTRQPRSSLGLRGVPTAGTKSWRDLATKLPSGEATHAKLRDIRILYEFPTDTQTTIRWNRNSKTHAVWVYLKTLFQPIDDTDEPWPTDTTLPTSVIAIGTDEFIVDSPQDGFITFVQLEPRAINGEVGNIVRIAFDPAAIIIEIEAPAWGIVTESESVGLGSFTVRLFDLDAVMDDVYYRTKSGNADWSAYILEDATPTDLDTYARTVAMVENHLSFIEFRGRYTINDVQRTVLIKSSGFDFGQVPNISLEIIIDTDGIVSANIQGDVDTASIKIAASTSSLPSDATTRAATPINGRMFTIANIGTLLTMNVGDTVYVKAFGYSLAGGGGNESTESVKANRIRVLIIAPTLEDEVQSETSTTGTFTVKVLDPQGFATDLYFRTKSGTGAWSSWTLKTATPTDGVSYTETVTLIENHLSFIEFQLWYFIDGDTFKIAVASGGFDKGKIPNITIIPEVDASGAASCSIQGDFDTASIKVAASISGIPSDATVRAASAINGRSITTAQVGTLLTATEDQRVFFAAYGYSATGAGGTESSVKATADATYSRGMIAPQIFVKEVRSTNTSVVTIDIEDPDLLVTAIEYKKRDGSESPVDTLDASWQTGWTSSTGTIGSSVTLQRVINVPVDPGLEGEMQWRVQFTDIDGSAQTVGDSFKVVNLEATSGSVMVPFTDLIPLSDSQTWTIFNGPGYIHGNSTSVRIWSGTVVLPPGVTATAAILVAYREVAGDSVILEMRKVADTASNSSLIVNVTHNTTGWQARSVTISEVIIADTIYYFVMTMDPVTAVTDTRFRGFKVLYDRPAYQYSI